MQLANQIFLLLPFALIALGYWVGRTRERSHLRSLDRREAELRDIFVTDLKTIPDPDGVTSARLVMGDAVMASDYFKSFASALRNLVGGEMKTLETLMSRARREAIVRMLDRARAMGAGEVHNVRLETSNIVNRARRRNAISAEVFAFGTAIVRS